MEDSTTHDLEQRIKELEAENERLRKGLLVFNTGKATVSVPDQFKPIFDEAQKTVGSYFESLQFNPSEGTIEIKDERYVLVRASALSYEFLNKIKALYADRGEDEAVAIGKNFLFDIAHVIGVEDAKSFHQKMKLENPLNKLSAGPIHFAYSGWAFVDILPESRPSPDENCYLKYHHPYSFEADSWLKSNEKSNFPVCIMNAGYSSGWCEESFGVPLTAVEISCRAKGDDYCTFIMAPPHKIGEYLKQEELSELGDHVYDIPLFFERKHTEEKIKSSLHEKDILLKEIHHRVKNNLQIISSLLNLQFNHLQNEELQVAFRESQNRIKTMALVHEKLYQSEVAFVDFSEYLKSICDMVRSSYSMKPVNMHYDLCKESVQINIDMAVSCGLVANEILSNAYKYAFKNRGDGNIHLTMQKQEEYIRLIFKDDGIGLPKDFDIKTSNSFGIELIQMLTEQADILLEVSSEKGTQYQLDIPIKLLI